MNYLSESFEDVFGVEYPYTKTDIDRVIMEQCTVAQVGMPPVDPEFLSRWWKKQSSEQRSKNSMRAAAARDQAKLKQHGKKMVTTLQKYWQDNPEKMKAKMAMMQTKIPVDHMTNTSTCEHCGKTGQSVSMKRWHHNNCKLK